MIHLTCTECGNIYPVREIDPAQVYRCLACSAPLSAATATQPVELPGVRPSVALLTAGSPLGRFTIVREIGRGGMGIVYQAKDEKGRTVAIKTLHLHSGSGTEESAKEEKRFFREAKLCAAIAGHPNIVRILEGGVAGGTYFLVMELVDGKPLHAWRRDPGVRLRDEVGLLRNVALAAHHAHMHGVVHRDLKPENVLVDGVGLPHVTDFGLARILGESHGISSTKSNEVVGTPPYVSPEQALKPKSVDYRTDIYAIGIMIYETLTGLLPFRGKSGMAMLMSIVHDPVAPPRQTPRGKSNSDVDETIEKICLKAMAKKAEERHPTAKALAEDLTKWLK
jgi:serine/threonine protein kinase